MLNPHFHESQCAIERHSHDFHASRRSSSAIITNHSHVAAANLAADVCTSASSRSVGTAANPARTTASPTD
jgi:hypothetical protein